MTATPRISALDNQKDDLQYSFLSQSLGGNMLSSYYIQPFWDILSQQQTTITDHSNTFAKPIGGSSPDSYHESNHPAVLPIGAPRVAIDDMITSPTQDPAITSLQQLMLLSQLNNEVLGNSLVIKDDVFLAQPSTLSRDVLYPTLLSTVIVDHDDNASLSSHSSLSSSQHSDKLTTSPCLSPVTSPTNFLYNHEPLFEGGIIQDLGNKKNNSTAIAGQDVLFDEEEYDDLSSVLTDSTTSEDNKQQHIHVSTANDDLDWFKLLDAFRADVACDLPETTNADDDQLSECSISSTFDDNSSSTSSSSSEDEDDDEIVIFVPKSTAASAATATSLKKRKRAKSETPVSGMYGLNLSDSDEEDHDHAPIKKKLSAENNAQTNPSQKRRKKNKATSFTPRYKKYQKKKNLVDNNSTESHLTAAKFNLPISSSSPSSAVSNTNTKNSTSTNKDKKEELDQNKDSISSPTRCQLIEPVAEHEKDTKTVFQHLNEASIDWCRYCGTTEGVNWRPGPWGKRTLCNKHGCDYKGYGLASRLPRLDLSAFSNEKLEERLRPVVQQFCIVCQSPEQTEKDNHLILCSGGCSRAYHQRCHSPVITVNPKVDPVRWYCSASCKENRKRNKVVVELPRKHMPLMHLLPKSCKKSSLAA